MQLTENLYDLDKNNLRVSQQRCIIKKGNAELPLHFLCKVSAISDHCRTLLAGAVTEMRARLVSHVTT